MSPNYGTPPPKKARAVSAWASVSKGGGKILHGVDGQLSIYGRYQNAKNDCPSYGEVRRVSIRVLPMATTDQPELRKEYPA